MICTEAELFEFFRAYLYDETPHRIMYTGSFGTVEGLSKTSRERYEYFKAGFILAGGKITQ